MSRLGRLFHLGIRGQLVLVMIAASVFFGGSVLAYLQISVTDALRETTSVSYRELCRTLAPVVGDHVLTVRHLELQLLLVQTTQRDPLLEFLVVTDPRGRVVSSSYGREIPVDLEALVSGTSAPGLASRDRGALLAVGDRDLLYLSVPVLRGRVGTLHAGVDLGPTNATARGLTRNLVLLFVVLTIAGVVVAFAMGWVLTAPLRQMKNMANQIGAGDLSGRIPVLASDEIGELASAFNEMTRKLASSQQALIRTAKLATAGTLAAGVAHEINNPLASLRACLWRIRTPSMPQDRIDHYHELLDRELRRIERTVQHLLEFSRPSTVRRTKTGLSEVADRAVRLVEPSLPQDSVRLEVLLDDSLPELDIDPNQIEQVIVNLLLNAVQSIRESGTNGTIVVRHRASAEHQVIEVADDGPGISEDDKARVFDPFFSTRPSGQGTGLGLAVSSSIVEAHGGRLTLRDRGEGRGVVFQMTLPVSTEVTEPRG